MIKEISFALKPINIELLHEEILVILSPLTFSGITTDENFIRVIVADSISSAEEALIATVVVSHEPLGLTQSQQDEEDRVINTVDIRGRLDASGLRDKTPQQIYTQLQNQIDAWTTIGDEKADLREWLPLLAAAVVWLSSKD